MQDFSRHLKEAIVLNTQRMPMYGALTNGKTIPFSEKLILFERIALCGAWFFDRIGDTLQTQGVPYLKDEFVEMSSVPDFRSCYPKEIDFEIPLEVIHSDALIREIDEQLTAHNFEQLAATCTVFIHENLSKQPHVYCMLRHLLESMALISSLVPIQEQRCLLLGLKAPTSYSVLMLKGHYWLLSFAIELDHQVAPIQQKGVPFLFQDLPNIALM